MASGSEFFQTVMGRQFYEGTMPRLVKALERLNDNMEKLAPAMQQPVKRDPYQRLDSTSDSIDPILVEVEDALRHAYPGPWKMGKVKLDEVAVDFPKADRRTGFNQWTNGITCWGSEENTENEAIANTMRANAHLVANAPRWLEALVAEVRRLREGGK